ncbi:MAG: hypothetical protein ACOZBH_05060 [Patescibacteria group bacterium]
MFGIFRGKKKGLSLFQQEKGALKAKYGNTPIPPLKHTAERKEKETIPGFQFASKCGSCGAFNIHVIEKSKSGILALICTKCNDVYETEVIADS